MGLFAGKLTILQHSQLYCGETLMVVDLEVADNMFSRMRGLLGRTKLPEGAGLLIVPCNSIHMFFMSFAIDAVFLSKSLEIIKVCVNLRPWQMAFCFSAHSVLELPAGTAQSYGLQKGRCLSVRHQVTGKNDG